MYFILLGICHHLNQVEFCPSQGFKHKWPSQNSFISPSETPFFTAPLFVVPWFTLHLHSNICWLKSQRNSLVLTKKLGIHNTEILL